MKDFFCLHFAQFSHISNSVALLPSVFLSVTLVLILGANLSLDLLKLYVTKFKLKPI